MRVCPVCQQSYSDATDFCPRDGSRLAPAVTPTEAELAAGLARLRQVAVAPPLEEKPFSRGILRIE